MKWFIRWRYRRLLRKRKAADEEIGLLRLNLKKGRVCDTLARQQLRERHAERHQIATKLEVLGQQLGIHP